jgi:hypothetical protein
MTTRARCRFWGYDFALDEEDDNEDLQQTPPGVATLPLTRDIGERPPAPPCLSHYDTFTMRSPCLLHYDTCTLCKEVSVTMVRHDVPG